MMLSVPVAGQKLVAKFDRLLVAKGKAWIFDWKTSRKKPEQAQYAEYWQTQIYRFVFAEAGAVLHGGRDIAPEDITLIYWHAQYPQVLRTIGYSSAEHEEARRLISTAIASNAAMSDATAFPKTDDLDECRRCEFHTDCDRFGARGAEWDKDENEVDWDLIPETEL